MEYQKHLVCFVHCFHFLNWPCLLSYQDFLFSVGDELACCPKDASLSGHSPHTVLCWETKLGLIVMEELDVTALKGLPRKLVAAAVTKGSFFEYSERLRILDNLDSGL